jgi:hypothetical protein
VPQARPGHTDMGFDGQSPLAMYVESINFLTWFE